MGNIQANDNRSLCGLSFLKSKDLKRTSLQRRNSKTPKTKSHTDLTPSTNCTLASVDSIVLKKVKSTEAFPEKELRIKRANTYHVIAKDDKEKPLVCENDFRIMQVLATGRYGRVYMVKKDTSKEMFAMKVIGKKTLSFQPCVESAMIEKEILEKASHPFIPKLAYSFENKRKIFLVMDYIEGGQLDKILKHLTRFSEEITKFYSAEVLLALEYLHDQLEVTYNDLKPENILLDSEGHIRLTDFDLAQKLDRPTSLTSSRIFLDSPPPEVIQGNMTGRMIDYWGFGCFLYELLTGKKPFQSGEAHHHAVDQNVLENKLEWPQFITKTAKDLIIRLLDPKVEERLGYNGIEEIKKHAFFSQVNWDKIMSKSVYPSLNPLQYKQPTQEEEDDDMQSESEDVNHCTLSYIPECGESKADLASMEVDLTGRRFRASHMNERM